MRSWFLHARESFWLVPSVFGLLAVGLALGLVEVDRLLVDAGINDIPLLEDLSATGGRAVLSAIGGTMLGVAATSFSITISVLATTSSAYGPRLVRNFMADRGNQIVLAVLTSTFLYSLVVLRSVRSEEDSSFTFVPVIAVSVAVILAIGDVAVLVYFIHHIATSVEVTTLQKRVLEELHEVTDRLYPPDLSEADPAVDRLEMLPPESRTPTCRADRSGYVEQIAIQQLVAAGQKHDVTFRVLGRPGDYVLEGDPLLDVVGADRAADGDDLEMTSAVQIGDARTPHQDLRFAVQQVVEIGVRGLASGTNDPYTAVGAVDALTGALVVLFTRTGPHTHYRDDDGTVRVVIDWPRAEQAMSDSLQAFRAYGLDHAIVVTAVVRLLVRLEDVVTGPARERLL